MKFRPCIDIHNGQVKQIVGGSLCDEGDRADENFVSRQNGDFFAKLYKNNGLKGGHIILLNPQSSDYYEADVRQAELALKEYPGGLQIGGGINADNAGRFIDMGASHVIATSYVFRDGEINYDNLRSLVNAVGREHLVLDLSCRKRDGEYYIVTDRWQKYTNVKIDNEILDTLSEYCDEYLVHAVDVEGKASGIETDVADMLGRWGKIPMTYAGGVASFDDLRALRDLGRDRIDVTIGSALDIFGGHMRFEDIINFMEG
ncbi:MAG: phosphoribosylformimino-5-aminoimidazole carboxamide ribotide isomerase [Clostridiales bacterium]|nr:phosphoribosylformimino-5-aminoimidazole carboxamide ribotide isomerase [Clostridiales bacterium]